MPITKKIPVIILAAGANTRMFPLNDRHHKGFFSLQGKTLIEHTLLNLSRHQWNDFILIVSPKDKERAETLAKTHQHIRVVIQKQALGMGDAILQAKQLIEDRFAVVFPYHFRAGEILDRLLATNQKIALTATHTDEPWNYGILQLDRNLANGIIEKPNRGREPSNWKVQGIYLLNQSFLSRLESQAANEYNFETALNQTLQVQPAGVIKLDRQLPSLKYPWQLFDLQAELSDQLTSFVDSAAQIGATAILDESQGPIFIENGAKIGDFAKIIGPAYIGRNCLVGDYSFIRQSYLEAGAQAGANSEIVRSIIFNQASIHYSYLADSILGEKSKIGAGLIAANKRLDRNSIKIKVKGKIVDSRRRRLGTIIGGGAQLAIGVKIMPGKFIGPNQQIAANSTIYHHQV